jgi:hypothetical protein
MRNLTIHDSICCLLIALFIVVVSAFVAVLDIRNEVKGLREDVRKVKASTPKGDTTP